MHKVINVQEAKAHLSRLLKRVSEGEEIVIAKNGKPVARLVSVEESSERREPGTAAGWVMICDDFDAPLPDEVLEPFEQ